MQICLLSSTFLPLVGGLEVVIDNLATALTELGHEVVLVTPYPKRRNLQIADNYPYKVYRFGFRGDGRLKLVPINAALTIAYVVKRYKIDVIHVHNVFTPGSWAYLYRKFNPSVPIIGTPHGDDAQITAEIGDGVRLDPRLDFIVRRNLNSFKRVTAISASFRKDLEELVDDKTRITDVPNGVWVKRYQESIDVMKVRKRFGIPNQSTVVISIGRNHPRKGFKFGLEAVALLKKKGLLVTYVVVGRNMEPIRAMARQLSIDRFLITPGQVGPEVVSELLKISDIYMSTSIVESFGLTTLEAMSAGLPCVVTDIPGSRDLVSPECGYLVRSGDPEKLFRALKDLIENPSKKLKMGKRAQIEASKYDWINVANQYLDVYQACLESESSVKKPTDF
jgi:glycosyltransferase involved in cell wall biosynthesis